MKGLLAPSLLILSSMSPNATAGEAPRPRCADLLLPLFGEQIQVLDPRVYETLHSHPISSLARALEQKRIPVHFRFFEAELQGLPRLLLGESIQTKALARILKEAFPSASIGTGDQGLTIPLNLTDHAEFGLDQRYREFNGPRIIEMSLMKAANPFVPLVSRAASRAHLGIPETKKVLAFYSDPYSFKKIGSLLDQIPDPERPEWIFLSTSYDASVDEALSQAPFLIPGYPLVKLSALKRGAVPALPERMMIYNDLKGQMPEIYSASDYAIVMAPNNIFEPLHTKTPTLFFTGKEILRNYSQATFMKMGKIAVASKGAVAVETVDGFKRGWDRLKEVRPSEIENPAFVRLTPESQTPFEILLNKIEGEVRAALFERLLIRE